MKFKKYIKNFDQNLILELNDKGNNLLQISKLINIPYKQFCTMCSYYKLNLIKKTKLNVNHHYFKKIDSEDKAYILGYIIADGSVLLQKRINKISKILTFNSSIDDKEVIELIQEKISINSKITIRDPKKIIKNNHYIPTKKIQLNLKINSDLLVESLIDLYNIVPNKTVNSPNFKLPNIDKKYRRHLIRGIFDGDGSINKSSISFTLNSKSICEDIANEMKSEIPKLTFRIRTIKGKSTDYYVLNINTGKGVRNQIKNYFYENSKFCLKRKKIKFDTWNKNQQN